MKKLKKYRKWPALLISSASPRCFKTDVSNLSVINNRLKGEKIEDREGRKAKNSLEILLLMYKIFLGSKYDLYHTTYEYESLYNILKQGALIF